MDFDEGMLLGQKVVEIGLHGEPGALEEKKDRYQAKER